MKSAIRQFWEQNADFSDRPPIDFDKHPTFSETTRQLQELIKLRPELTELVELGSGSGEYLNYLKSKLPLKRFIGSDVESPRLQRASSSFPDLTFEAADALEMVKKHNRPGVIFLAMNVICSLEPKEIKKLFSLFKIYKTAFVFCDRGIRPDLKNKFLESPNNQFDHNMLKLLQKSRLTVRYSHIKFEHNEQNRGIYIMSSTIDKPIKQQDCA